MKRALSFLVILLLTGCAHYNVEQFDRRAGTITVARNRHGDQEGLDERATQWCAPRQAQLIGCGQGSRAVVSTWNHHSGTSYGVANADDAYRCSYHCQ
jgi:hypothetical protein